MTLDEIILGFRMIAMGRPNQEYAQNLAEALAKVLATPEERLVEMVADTQEEGIESTQTATAPVPDKPKRGRPPKIRVSDGENDAGQPAAVPE